MVTFGYLFKDRRDAGKQLSEALLGYKDQNPVILALPRGGVIVADEVARRLKVPLDVLISRKIGAPGYPEFGIGALSEDEEPYFGRSSLPYINTESDLIQETVQNERRELRRRVQLFREGAHLPDLEGKCVIVVDDGLATGVTAIAAAKCLRKLHPKELILAIPVGPDFVDAEVANSYDSIKCLYPIRSLTSVGAWYRNFDQTTDKEVIDVLRSSKRHDDKYPDQRSP